MLKCPNMGLKTAVAATLRKALAHAPRRNGRAAKCHGRTRMQALTTEISIN